MLKQFNLLIIVRGCKREDGIREAGATLQVQPYRYLTAILRNTSDNFSVSGYESTDGVIAGSKATSDNHNLQKGK